VTGPDGAPAFAALGPGGAIHPTVLVFGAEHVEVGTNVRIDAHCIITAGPGRVTIGDNVHIGAATHLFGTAGVEIADFANVSSRVSLFSTNDDYTEGHLTNPTVPASLRKVEEAPVRLGRHAIVGCGTVVLPGVTVGTGAAVGALSLVKHDVDPFTVVAGTPAHPVGTRDRERLEALERRLREG
jgi:acetyltransferase-like isoleucine patch superfamily enzyme